MNKFKAFVAALLLSIPVMADYCETFQLQWPNPNVLSHGNAYTWGIEYLIPEDFKISEATLSLMGVNDWANEVDTLYINMLDNTDPGWTVLTDNTDDNVFSNAFNEQGMLIAKYSDEDGYYGWQSGTPSTNLTYNLDTDLVTSYLENGTIGFGFDPDCAYYTKGINLKIKLVPEPSTMLLFLFGGLNLLVASRLRRNKK